MSQSVERQLGGEIAFDGHQQGLTVRLALPADQLAGAAVAAAPSRHPALATPPRPGVLGGQRVLIVEDETLISPRGDRGRGARACRREECSQGP